MPSAAVAIAAGGWHNCALLDDGTVRCWGHNYQGQLGDGTFTGPDDAVPLPVQVAGVTNATAIAAGSSHTCALLEGGSVRCWGRNIFGQLGNGTQTNSSVTVPVPVSGIADAIAIGGGDEQTCALRSTGSVWCWGRIVPGGPFGGGSSSAVPVAIAGITTATAISVGGTHVCALLQSGTVLCWGSNSNGQLGNGTTSMFPASTPTPVGVTGISTTIALATGSLHSCALLGDGSMRCWGANSWGQLGNGTQTQSSVPVAVTGISTGVAVGADGVHTCAVLADETMRCWGRNSDGQLGDGTTTESSIPVQVTGLDTATDVVAGRTHTCGLLADGTVACWGANVYGQLGNGTTSASTTPVAVNGLP